jgi:adenylosuccinate synthase
VKISAVIGANYGDEGKGLITDYLASKWDSALDSGRPMVIRFNGGAQAGHTVVTPTGARHVFHHFGSGTLAGAPTFLSGFFICHPMFFGNELKELKDLIGNVPEVYVDPLCMLSTPWDIMLNHAAEKDRRDGKHGSCGMGINETVHRNQSGYILQVKDLFGLRTNLEDKLAAIRHEYFTKRRHELSLVEDAPFRFDQRVWDHYIEDCKNFVHLIAQCSWSDLDLKNRDLIFEGAQGLRLDMDGKDFPHVTRSKTGITNVKTLLKERDLYKVPVDAYYVSRTYLTRHGAGPLENEWTTKELNVVDDTNVHNDHQEHLRYAWLDIDQLTDDIHTDLEAGAGNPEVRPHLALTHVDQVNSMSYYMSVGNGFNISTHLMVSSPLKFAEMVSESLGSNRYLMSFGKTRKDVRWVQYG